VISCKLTTKEFLSFLEKLYSADLDQSFLVLKKSLRLISTTRLHELLRFHLSPINQIIFLESYLANLER
jgi:hypothetical protein